jgi:hypothetical protein
MTPSPVDDRDEEDGHTAITATPPPCRLTSSMAFQSVSLPVFWTRTKNSQSSSDSVRGRKRPSAATAADTPTHIHGSDQSLISLLRLSLFSLFSSQSSDETAQRRHSSRHARMHPSDQTPINLLRLSLFSPQSLTRGVHETRSKVPCRRHLSRHAYRHDAYDQSPSVAFASVPSLPPSLYLECAIPRS